MLLKRIIMIIFLSIFLLTVSCASPFWTSDPENTPTANFEIFWKNYQERYALFDIKGVDWDAVYDEYKPRISNDMSDNELFTVLSEMQSLLDDKHVFLHSSFGVYNAGGWPMLDVPFEESVVRDHYLTNPRKSGEDVFTWGTLASNIGYIHIAAFAEGPVQLDGHQPWTEDIGEIIKALQDCSSIVIDVRGNTGGLPHNVEYIAGWFTNRQYDYMSSRIKNGPGKDDYDAAIKSTIYPQTDQPYLKPVILITDINTISGGEWFTMAMKARGDLYHTGERTAGALSLSLAHELPNGWVYRISVQQIRDHNGFCPEGGGIVPERAIVNSLEELSRQFLDRQLEAALNWALEL